ncbi:FMN reductase [Rhodococcoides trifolii]|uniref:FMN reductase n=1 Tax=Rhodococcoides trifolii TaxID=908250 RepID=A0A917FYL2_9NOCA|nr:NAD(P)H-dependent oxidoreductase [Rhodococcus trifolii]GGG14248.1 FMN reductase [Rhodococcus trifolii]
MSLRLEIIIGSVRQKRFGPVVSDWFTDKARTHGEFDVGVIDLADFDLPVDFSASESKDAFTARIGAADAFVAVTPEYNHGYPAALKTAFDSVKPEWKAKPIGFVSYGGLSGGLRAVEQLRLVAAEAHMVSIRETVSFHVAKERFDANGQTEDGAAIDAAARLLDQLLWWATALADKRASYPR